MEMLGGKHSAGIKTYPNDFFLTTHSTWTVLGLNPGLRGGKAASKRLNWVLRSIFMLRSVSW